MKVIRSYYTRGARATRAPRVKYRQIIGEFVDVRLIEKALRKLFLINFVQSDEKLGQDRIIIIGKRAKY